MAKTKSQKELALELKTLLTDCLSDIKWFNENHVESHLCVDVEVITRLLLMLKYRLRVFGKPLYKKIKNADFSGHVRFFSDDDLIDYIKLDNEDDSPLNNSDSRDSYTYSERPEPNSPLFQKGGRGDSRSYAQQYKQDHADSNSEQHSFKINIIPSTGDTHLADSLEKLYNQINKDYPILVKPVIVTGFPNSAFSIEKMDVPTPIKSTPPAGCAGKFAPAENPTPSEGRGGLSASDCFDNSNAHLLSDDDTTLLVDLPNDDDDNSPLNKDGKATIPPLYKGGRGDSYSDDSNDITGDSYSLPVELSQSECIKIRLGKIRIEQIEPSSPIQEQRQHAIALETMAIISKTLDPIDILEILNYYADLLDKNMENTDETN